MKKPLLLASVLLSALSLTGCNNSGATKIGILLPVQHAALDAAADGFIEVLNKSGLNVTIDRRNAGGNAADQTTYAKDLVANCKLTLGIGTGASQSLQAAEENAGLDNPILFTAVTDPVDAALVSSLEAPGGHITGSSDANPVSEQIGLVKSCLPDADKIGIIYTSSESNSEVQANQAKAAAQAAGLTVTVQTCTGPSDVASIAEALCSVEGLDAIYIPTDNNIAANMNAIKTAADLHHTLVVTGESNMMKAGGHITLSVDYTALGKATGEMAVSILKGEKTPAEIPVRTMKAEECEWVVSTSNLRDAGITIPADILAKCTDASAQ